MSDITPGFAWNNATKLAWAAGVFDSSARYGIRKDGRASVWISCENDLAELLTDAVQGGRYNVFTGVWSLAPDEQAAILARILPYLATPTGQREANVIYQYRLGSPKRRVGWSIDEATREFREELQK